MPQQQQQKACIEHCLLWLQRIKRFMRSILCHTHFFCVCGGGDDIMRLFFSNESKSYGRVIQPKIG